MASPGELPGEFQTGDLIGGTYTVVGYIGRGAMGHLYHVRHAMLNSEYALKTLSSEKVTEVDWKRFQVETQTTATMSHPNVVSVHNSGFHEKRLPFYVMDLLRGRDLARKIKADGPADVNSALAIFLEVCAGIGYAHKKGIIHRDIKPGNVFLLEKPEPSGARVKVVDFGIAKLTVVKNQDTQSLTGVGDVVGTPYYMSPEQCMALRVDARSDIYSVGCTLFETLTGTFPFRGRNPTEIMILHQNEPPPTLRRAAGGKEFSSALERIIATTLAKEPSERYQSMDQLALELTTVLQGEKPINVTQGRLPQVSAEEARDGAATTSSAFRLPTVPVPVTETNRALDADQANPFTYVSKKMLLTIVAPSVAGILAFGGLAYWGAKKSKQSLDEQLKTFSQKASDKASDGLAADKTDYERETAILEQSRKKLALESGGPFATIRKEGGTDMRVFTFPVDVVIGQLKDGGNNDWKKASGEVKFKKSVNVIFKPDETVTTYSDFLKRFRPGDIYGVEFSPEADSQMMRAMLEIPDLQELDCSKSPKLADISANTLKQFHNLKKFFASSNQTDCKQLVQADCWSQIEEVYLPTAKNVSPFLKQLQEIKSLRKLGLGPCQLTDEDYKTIGKMPNLDYLDMNNNPVNNRNLSHLTALEHVNTLNLINSDVDMDAVNALRQFKSLSALYISSPRMPKDYKEEIRKALPKVKVHDRIDQ